MGALVWPTNKSNHLWAMHLQISYIIREVNIYMKKSLGAISSIKNKAAEKNIQPFQIENGDLVFYKMDIPNNLQQLASQQEV